MFDAILAKLAVRQMSALNDIPEVIKKLPSLLFAGKLKALFSGFLAVFQLFGVILFDYPGPVLGDEINLNDYSLVFSDEFNGTSLDKDVWQECFELGTGEIFDESMLSFDGSNMIISTQYKEDGSKGPGWYTYGIENTDEYTVFKPGCYYECRCIVPAAKGMWSAFWLMTDGQKKWENGRHTEYTEIDVMESFYYGEKYQNSTINTVHKYDPVADNFKSEIVGKYRVNKNIYKEYVTYGVYWAEDGFIFYIDGKESGRSKNGVTSEPGFMLLSCQVRLNGKDNPPIYENEEGLFPAKFIVDYVRVYSKNITEK